MKSNIFGLKILKNFHNFLKGILGEIREWIEFTINNIPGKSGFFLEKFIIKFLKEVKKL